MSVVESAASRRVVDVVVAEVADHDFAARYSDVRDSVAREWDDFAVASNLTHSAPSAAAAAVAPDVAVAIGVRGFAVPCSDAHDSAVLERDGFPVADVVADNCAAALDRSEQGSPRVVAGRGAVPGAHSGVRRCAGVFFPATGFRALRREQASP